MSGVNFIIWQPWGGLGDNVQFSTLPEQLTKAGNDVYLSTINAYRNIEIFDIVWKTNPWIKGFSQLPPNCGWIGCDPHIQYPNRHIFGINKWENLYGAPLTAGIPRIYWEPPRMSGLENTVLVDLSYTSCEHYEYTTMPVVYSEIAKRWPDANPLQVTFANKNVCAKRFKSKFQEIQFKDIWDYSIHIANCRAIVTLLSGASPLASALKFQNPLPDILTIKKWWYTEGQIFPNADFVDELK